MPLDRAKLVKALAMTASTNDHEALAAIRMANRMLREAGIGWSGLISGSRSPVRRTGPPPDWMRPAPSLSIDEALEFLAQAGEGDDWLAIRRQWERRKYMAPSDQRRMFDRIYDIRRGEDEQRDVPEA